MAGWHHWLDGCESQWTPGVDDGQGGLACCDSWGCKELDTTEWLNWTERCYLYTCILESFFFLIINGFWILSEVFSASIEITIWVYSSIRQYGVLYWLISRYWKILVLGIKSTWSWCMILLMEYWIWFAILCWGFFASMFISDIEL